MNEYKVMSSQVAYLVEANFAVIENNEILILFNEKILCNKETENEFGKIQAIFKNWDFFLKTQEVIDE